MAVTSWIALSSSLPIASRSYCHSRRAHSFESTASGVYGRQCAWETDVQADVEGSCWPAKSGELTGFWSTSTLRNTALAYSRLSASNSGATTLQGPHHVAQKSTTTCSANSQPQSVERFESMLYIKRSCLFFADLARYSVGRLIALHLEKQLPVRSAGCWSKLQHPKRTALMARESKFVGLQCCRKYHEDWKKCETA